MQNIDIVQLNYIATLNGELTVCMPPCLTYTKNRSFGVKGFSLVTNSIPVFIPKLYTRSLTAIYTEINTASDYIYNFNDNNNTCVMIDNTLNPAFNYNGQTYNTTTYPILQVQRNLYSNTNETVKYFHCFNFIYFLSMIESQMQTVNNGILFNYNMNDNTISISVLKSYIDAGNTIAFNKSFLKVLPFIVKYFDGVMDHIYFNKKLIITLNTDDYYTAACVPNFTWFNRLHIGADKSIIKPTEIPATGDNAIANQLKKIIMSFRFIPSGPILPNIYQADNSTIAIYHNFMQDYNNETLNINVYLQINNELTIWKLNENDNVDLDLLIYNTNNTN